MTPTLLMSMAAIVALAAGCDAGDGSAATAARDSATAHATAPPAGDTASARRVVLALQNELVQGWVRSDTAPAHRIMADEYLGVAPDGGGTSKTEAITYLRRGSASPRAVEEARIDSATVRVYGTVAVVDARGTIRWRSGRPASSERFRATDVFVWRDGRWQEVVHHATRIDPR